jgi:hypothetical protein
MSKIKTVLDSDFIKAYGDKHNTTISADLNKKLSPVIQEIVYHFKMDRWPLSFDHIRSNIFSAVFGVDDLAFVCKELSKKGINVAIGTKEGETVLFLPEKKKKAKKTKTKVKGKKKNGRK